MTLSRRAALGGLGAAGLSLAAAPAFAQEAESQPGWAGFALTPDGRIETLDPLGPAARAGLRPGDAILAWRDGPLGELPAALTRPPGEAIRLIVRRAGAERGLCLVLEAKDARP